MSIDNKRKLSRLVYFTLAVLAILNAGFFVYAVFAQGLVMWARIVYIVWSALVIAVVIYDIICTKNQDGKQSSGFFIYILSLLAVIMSCILYFMNVGVAGLATEFFNLFISVSILSLMTTGYLIATWCVGESLVEHTTSQDEMREKANR